MEKTVNISSASDNSLEKLTKTKNDLKKKAEINAILEKYNLKPEDTIIAVLPGSRLSDLNYLAPVFIETIKKINRIHSKIKFFVPLPNEKLKSKFEFQIMKRLLFCF